MNIKSEFSFIFHDYRFRTICKHDLAFIKDWRNEDATRQQFIHTNKLTSDDQDIWFEKYVHNETDMMFMVVDESNLNCVGAAALYNIDVLNAEAEFGRLMIGNLEYRGKGMGKIVTLGLTAFAFYKMGLSKVYLEVYEDNLPAFKSYLAVGYQITSTKKLVKERMLVRLEIQKESFCLHHANLIF